MLGLTVDYNNEVRITTSYDDFQSTSFQQSTYVTNIPSVSDDSSFPIPHHLMTSLLDLSTLRMSSEDIQNSTPTNSSSDAMFTDLYSSSDVSNEHSQQDVTTLLVSTSSATTNANSTTNSPTTSTTTNLESTIISRSDVGATSIFVFQSTATTGLQSNHTSTQRVINSTKDPSSIIFTNRTESPVSSTFIENSFTSTVFSNSKFGSNSESDHFDRKGLAAALGTVGVLLVVLVIGVMITLWLRSKKQKIRMTLKKLRCMGEQSQSINLEGPPDLCLDVDAFNLVHVFQDNTYFNRGGPDVTSHMTRRMLSAHEDALNFSKQEMKEKSLSMSELEDSRGSSNVFSHFDANESHESSNNLRTCRDAVSKSESNLVNNSSQNKIQISSTDV